jgi:hypothetical protein
MQTVSFQGAGYLAITRPSDVSAIIAKLEGTEGAFLLPLYRAALAGETRVLTLLPGGRVPQRMLEHTAPNTVIVLSGDPGLGHDTPSPDAFPQARRLLAWAASTMIHAAGGQAGHYAAVVDAVRLVRRVLLIETATAQEDAWRDLARAEHERRERVGRALPTLVVSARPLGGVHPIQESGR